MTLSLTKARVLSHPDQDGTRVDERELVVPRAQNPCALQGQLQDPDLAVGLRAIITSLTNMTRQKVA